MDEICNQIVQTIRELKVKEDKPIIIAIEGRCAAGKTTLAEQLTKMLDCNLYHMDDFFLQPHQRTEKRMLEIGGNVDYERVEKEIIHGILAEKQITFTPYSCKTQGLTDAVEIGRA